jgi:hypothetical protein
MKLSKLKNTVAYLLRAKTVEPEKRSLLGNSCVTREHEGLFCANPCRDFTMMTGCHYELEEEVGGRWFSASEEVSTGIQESPLFEDITKHCSEDYD